MPSPEKRKWILWGSGLVAACFFALQLAPPIAAYFNSTYTGFLKQLASASYIGLLGVGLIVWLLMRTGVLPSSPQGTSVQPYRFSPRGMVLNFLFWIVVAVVLVFFFNLAQNKDFGPLDDKTLDLLTQILPFILMLGVWLFFLWRMQANKKRDLDGGNAP